MDLGVLINLYEQTDVPAASREATEAGFGRGQVSSFVHGITAQEIRRGARCARDAGLAHLKDFAPGTDGLPRFLPEVPVVIEQISGVAEMRAAREFVQKTLKECGL